MSTQPTEPPESFEVPEPLDGERIDRTVSFLTDVSRRLAASMIADGNVVIDGRVAAKPSIKVNAGSTITVTLPPPESGPEPDASVDLVVLFEDEHVAVIDKAAGLVVHPGAGVHDGTLVNALIHRYPEVVGAAAEAGVEANRPGIVHRLDKGTSGVLMVARSALAHTELSAQLADRTVMRRYLTLVEGDVSSDEGLIDGPLGRSPRDATRQAVVVGGKEARTRYEVLERFTTTDGVFTMLACRLETGRTHQIRAHLEAIGHPVAGDDRYGSRQADSLGLERPFLHAADLGFEHPESGELMMFSAPVPDDLAVAEAVVRRMAADHERMEDDAARRLSPPDVESPN